jgi:hypothetical protein
METSLSKDVIQRAAKVSTQLSDLGYQSEGSYVIAETIEAARTEQDLSDIIREMIPVSIRATPDSPHHQEAVGGLSELFTDLMKLHLPYAAVRVYMASHLLEPPGLLFTHGHAETVYDLIQHEHEVGEHHLDLKHRLTQAGTEFLNKGRPEGMLLFVSACRVGGLSAKSPIQFDNWYGRIKPRPTTRLSPDVIFEITELARKFAQAGRYPSAVGLGLIIPPLADYQRQGVDVTGGRLLEVARSSPSSRPLVLEPVAREAADLGRHLIKMGYHAEGAEFCQLALNLPESDSKAWEPVWNTLDNEILSNIPAARPSVGTRIVRRFTTPLSKFRNISARSAGPERRVSMEEVVANIAVESTRLASGSALQQENNEPDARRINVWIEGRELPLVVRDEYTIKVNIGASRQNALASERLPEIDWGDQDHLDLVISLDGDGLKVKPAWKPAVLHKLGGMEEVEFKVTPYRAGDLELYLSIYLAPELVLLEELRISVESVVAVASGGSK